MIETSITFFRPADINEDEYLDFYKSITKTQEEPLAKIHFTAEGEVTFKSILFVPKAAPRDLFQNYGKRVDSIKVSIDLFVPVILDGKKKKGHINLLVAHFTKILFGVKLCSHVQIINGYFPYSLHIFGRIQCGRLTLLHSECNMVKWHRLLINLQLWFYTNVVMCFKVEKRLSRSIIETNSIIHQRSCHREYLHLLFLSV